MRVKTALSIIPCKDKPENYLNFLLNYKLAKTIKNSLSSRKGLSNTKITFLCSFINPYVPPDENALERSITDMNKE